MSHTADKVTTLERAVRDFVKEGSHIAIGGFTINRNPMAAVHEIIRQRIGNLHVYAHSNGQGLDELIGSGAVKRLEVAYSGNGRFAPTCFCFRRAVESGTITVEDYTNYQMALRFLAGAMGIPFMPTYTSLGTDIVEKWGFPPGLRESDERLAVKKLVKISNPFSREREAEKIVLVPAVNPDVTVLHVQKADKSGYAGISGLTFADVEQAKAARYVVVTCEEIVTSTEIKEAYGLHLIPSFCVDAVVQVRFGAYPTACFGWYDYDPVFFENYRQTGRSPDAFSQYLREYVHAVDTHDAYLARFLSDERRDEIAADPVKGYSLRIRRK